VDGRKQVLLQKRAMNKDSYPGGYDTSSAGHIQAGDEPLESAIRELGEELGLVAEPSQLKFAGTIKNQYQEEFYGKMFRDDEIAFVFVYQGEVDIEKLTLQTEEVESVDWFDLEDTYQECLNYNPKFCVPMAGLRTVREYLSNIMKYKNIRKLKYQDREEMYEWLHDDDVIRWFTFDGKKMLMKDVDEFILNSECDDENQHLAVVDSDIYAGTISLKKIDYSNRRAEMAIALRSRYHHTGIASKAMKEFFDLTKSEYKLHKLYLNVMSENHRAKRFYEKMDFKYVGTSKDHICKDGKYVDLDWYEKILED
jgi:RimJ/RimL family protein N-acetyltransferase/isopentenyldiphosphate isomerase